MKNEIKTEGRTIKKWYTTSENVDQETGEIITKKIFENEYYKTKTERKIEINENYGIIKYINIGRNRYQQRLFE